MTIALQEAAQFSVQGTRYRRLNPDGSTPTPARTVTKAGTFDSSTLAIPAAGVLRLKLDGFIN